MYFILKKDNAFKYYGFIVKKAKFQYNRKFKSKKEKTMSSIAFYAVICVIAALVLYTQIQKIKCGKPPKIILYLRVLPPDWEMQQNIAAKIAGTGRGMDVILEKC